MSAVAIGFLVGLAWSLGYVAGRIGLRALLNDKLRRYQARRIEPTVF
jgi:hypothetical protein